MLWHTDGQSDVGCAAQGDKLLLPLMVGLALVSPKESPWLPRRASNNAYNVRLRPFFVRGSLQTSRFMNSFSLSFFLRGHPSHAFYVFSQREMVLCLWDLYEINTCHDFSLQALMQKQMEASGLDWRLLVAPAGCCGSIQGVGQQACLDPSWLYLHA
mmetsp:Transcript_128869/g.321459  ORF Transcript_128869/g.321459 Transcript_128869/m.321459 type:complete len:157 (-) Transcript_128869:1105-1575(-)